MSVEPSSSTVGPPGRRTSSRRQSDGTLVLDADPSRSGRSFGEEPVGGMVAQVWKSIASGRSKYTHYLELKWRLKFKDPKVEKEYGNFLRASYRFRNPVTGIYMTVVIGIIWAAISVLLRRQTLAITDPIFTDLFDAVNGLSILCVLILGCSNSIKCIRRNPEPWCYVLTFPFYFLWISWIIAVLTHGSVKRDELMNSVLSVFTAIQFKFWTDTSILVVLFLIFAIYDQLMNTRTMFVVWLHVVAFLLYMVSRLLTIFIFTDLTTRKIIPTIVLASVVQMFVALGLIVQAYIGRWQKELSERIAFLDVREDRLRLKELREQQKKRKRGKAETVTEDLIHSIKKTRTTLQAAAFEQSAQGDASLLELNEILRQCIEILLDTDDLFAVGGVEGAEGTEETKFINMFQISRGKGHEAGGKGGAIKRRTGEDMLRPAFEQQEFFTPEILPEFDEDADIVSGAGRTAGLKMLDLYKSRPYILVDFGNALLFPFARFLGVDRLVITKYLYQIQRRYFRNPYHNPCHGAMVAHMVCLISKMLEVDVRVQPIHMFALVIGALAHDVGHPGRNNNFFINAGDLLARTYNDTAVLENYHSFLCFRYAQIAGEVNIFQNLSVEDYRVARAHIIENILITDMAQHFAAIGKFRIRSSSEKFDIAANPEDAQLALRLCMKMADLSHAMVDWQQHLDWSLRVTEEFYQQGAEEESLKLPISPLCDASVHRDLPKSQAGFLQFVVIPLANELSEIDAAGVFTGELVSKILFNKHKWEMLKEKGDTVEIFDEIKATKTAPPRYADCLLIQALSAKTVDELNADPTSLDDVKSIMIKVENMEEEQRAEPRKSLSQQLAEPDEEEYEEEEEEEEEESEEEEEEPVYEEEEEEEEAEEEEEEAAAGGGAMEITGEDFEIDQATGVLSPRGGGRLLSPHELTRSTRR